MNFQMMSLPPTSRIQPKYTIHSRRRGRTLLSFLSPATGPPHLPSTQPGNEAIQPEKEALNYVSTQPGTEALNSQPANEALSTLSLFSPAAGLSTCRRALHLPPVRPGNEALNPIPTQPGYPSLTSASPSEYQARLKPVLQLPPAAWTSGP